MVHNDHIHFLEMHINAGIPTKTNSNTMMIVLEELEDSPPPAGTITAAGAAAPRATITGC